MYREPGGWVDIIAVTEALSEGDGALSVAFYSTWLALFPLALSLPFAPMTMNDIVASFPLAIAYRREHIGSPGLCLQSKTFLQRSFLLSIFRFSFLLTILVS